MADLNRNLLRWLNVVAFLLVVAVNALANILPINGIGTGAVSDSYPNLFAPIGLTFAIWGVIYLLLAVFTIYQAGFDKQKPDQSNTAVQRIGIWFIVSSAANAVWIFSWHYQLIPLSMVLMLVILVSLIIIYLKIRQQPLTLAEKLCVELPFSVYFGWITVATIANVTTLLVDLKWDGWGLSEPVWMIVALAAGLLIGCATVWLKRDAAYGLVLFWAYLGILLKHLSADYFAGKYPAVTVSVIAALVVILATIVLAIARLAPASKKT